MIRDISIRILLILSFLVSGLIPTMIISLVSLSSARVQLQDQVFRQLESVRNIKKEQINNFFNERVADISIFSQNPYLLQALEDLDQAFHKTGGSEQQVFKGKLDEEFDAPPEYRRVHERYFGYFKNLIHQSGYYDFFLIDAEYGDTVFTVRKESDFGIRIDNVQSSLRDVWLAAKNEKRIALSDTKPYPPSENAPAQFLAAPVWKGSRLAGIVAVQISIDSIDNIMRERSGMWQSGETYLVGPDKKMRSDSYIDQKNHSVHASFSGTAERNGVDTEASRKALEGGTGSGILVNYQGREVLSAYTPIVVRGVKWAMIAEVEKKEIDSYIASALDKKIVFLFAISILIVIMISSIISIIIGNGIKKTIAQLEKMIRDVLKGNLQARGDPDSVGVDFKGVVENANQLIDAFQSQWQEKRKLEEHIQYTQRLKAIGTLAGGIAHDFNNILTSIFAYCNIVMVDLPKNSATRENMSEIKNAARRASELVEQIMTFSSQTKMKNQPVDITRAIAGTVKLLNATLPRSITIRSQIKTDALFVNANPSQIHQILLNLCTNANHAMREKGGILNITAGKTTIDAHNQHNLKEGDYCEISISDTGHGIPVDIADQIFEPFFTTKPVGQGSGMGLAMVHGIVRNYGGMIHFTSSPGMGATFFVFLPLLEKSNQALYPIEVDEPTIKGKGHILLVDDDEAICRAQTTVLESLEYTVTAGCDSREAAALFAKNPSQFDLVLTDFNMPYLDGLELAHKLKALRPEIPIIISTSLSHYNIMKEKGNIQHTGIKAFLLKPYEADKLSRVIANVLAEARRVKKQ